MIVLSFSIRLSFLHVKFKEACLPPPERPVFFCDTGQRVALADSNKWFKVLPADRADEGSGPGVISQLFHASQAQAVATGQLPRIVKDLLAHTTRQRLLQLPLHNIHLGRPPARENQLNQRLTLTQMKADEKTSVFLVCWRRSDESKSIFRRFQPPAEGRGIGKMLWFVALNNGL